MENHRKNAMKKIIKAISKIIYCQYECSFAGYFAFTCSGTGKSDVFSLIGVYMIDEVLHKRSGRIFLFACYV
jgi:hypothetical protein